jgi:hypothetical protein
MSAFDFEKAVATWRIFNGQRREFLAEDINDAVVS